MEGCGADGRPLGRISNSILQKAGIVMIPLPFPTPFSWTETSSRTHQKPRPPAAWVRQLLHALCQAGSERCPVLIERAVGNKGQGSMKDVSIAMFRDLKSLLSLSLNNSVQHASAQADHTLDYASIRTSHRKALEDSQRPGFTTLELP